MNNEKDTKNIETLQAEELPDKVNVIGVSFRDSGKVYYFAANGTVAKEGSGVIVETARGVEYGKVAMANRLIPKTELVLPLKKVLRAATEEDEAHLAENRRKEEEAFALCQQKIAEHGLDMKLIEVEYTFDHAKLLFYFASENRVDFRELVKDLAGIFHTRIELRQIGIRDETKMMGGLGVCYREYCCHSFLSDFAQVSIKMAKEQGLSLNSAKISGACGRLMCCLRFEHETYQEEIKRTPKVGALLVTPDGTGTVIESKPLVGLVKVRLDADPEGAPKIYDRDLVRLKTDEDETTQRGEKVERPAKPAFVPFTPLNTDEKAGQGGEKSRPKSGKDQRKGEKKPNREENPDRSGGKPNGRGKSGGKGGKSGKQPKQGQSRGSGDVPEKSPEKTPERASDKTARGAERARYVQPPKDSGEPTLRADLIAPAEEGAGGKNPGGNPDGGRRNRNRRFNPNRRSENSAKKSENPTKND